MTAQIHVRPARAGEEALLAPLLYAVSPAAHDRFAGGRARALKLIATGLERSGTSGSTEVTYVAEVAARPAGIVCCYPVSEGADRAAAYAGIGLRQAPVWRRPLMLRFLRRVERATPPPAPDSLYVDALGTAPELRRRGVASALLAAAEDRGRRLGLVRVSLETEVDNDAARALYERCGFERGEVGPSMRGLPRYVAYVKQTA
ncbi:MAG: GNAT family N-acetyltransferase [Solirubrobacterales bacterium]